MAKKTGDQSGPKTDPGQSIKSRGHGEACRDLSAHDRKRGHPEGIYCLIKSHSRGFKAEGNPFHGLRRKTGK